ncbi:MAG: hypothetical protein M3083_03995 [Actinomycetota bacterium]|nr:hypothetical protein [Actinomycetota bacterium]
MPLATDTAGPDTVAPEAPDVPPMAVAVPIAAPLDEAAGSGPPANIKPEALAGAVAGC